MLFSNRLYNITEHFNFSRTYNPLMPLTAKQLFNESELEYNKRMNTKYAFTFAFAINTNTNSNSNSNSNTTNSTTNSRIRRSHTQSPLNTNSVINDKILKRNYSTKVPKVPTDLDLDLALETDYIDKIEPQDGFYQIIVMKQLDLRKYYLIW